MKYKEKNFVGKNALNMKFWSTIETCGQFRLGEKQGSVKTMAHRALHPFQAS